MFNQFKLSTRIISMGIAIVAAFMLLLTWIFMTVSDRMYEAKHIKTRHLTEAAWTVIDNLAQQAKAGSLSTEDAQKLAIATIKAMRYDEKEYFWINDMSPKMIMHPFKPELDGTDISQMADPNGKKLFVEFVEVCRKSGGGEVEYEWPKPNVSKPVPKVSYVKLQSDWGWIVGTGVYMDDVKAEMASFFYTLLSVVLVIALASLGLIYFMSRSITKPINDAVEKLSAGAEQVGSASDHISTASQSLAEATTEQASSLQETSSALEEMSSMTKQNAENANQANQLANIARTATDKGTHAMESMSKAITEIKHSSDETAKIIKVIDEIAFQTNLLALNAAVEAARAGEAGKGFAVVAEEVRNLAQRSAEAAKNTNSLIEGSQKNADNGVNATQEFTSILNDINSSVKKVTDLIAEVSAASNEQAQGIEQVNMAISQLNQVTQQNAASSEESSSASEELAAQAQQMNGVVTQLRGVVEGSRGSTQVYSDHLDLPPIRNGVSRTFTKVTSRVQSSVSKKSLSNKRSSPTAQKTAAQNQKSRASDMIPFGDDVNEFK